MPVHNKAFDSLEEDFKPIVDSILTQLEAKGYQPIVAEGRRTVEQQKEKVRLGYSQTMHSIHLTGLAADIVDTRYMWDIPLHHQFWYDYGNIVKNLNPKRFKLRWGGVWDHPERWALIERAVKEKTDKPLTYFADMAHCEARRL